MTPMKIASWNVNSLKVRLPHLTQWLADAQPDVVALQETKLEDAKFPVDELAAAGYRAVFSGQKTYNGVALLARAATMTASTDVVTDIPGLDDPQRRILAATVGARRRSGADAARGQPVRGQRQGGRRRKIRLQAGLAGQAARVSSPTSWRVIRTWWCWAISTSAPDDRDVYDPVAWGEDILCSPPERAALAAITELGLHDSFRLLEPEPATTAGGITGKAHFAATWACAST